MSLNSAELDGLIAAASDARGSGGSGQMRPLNADEKAQLRAEFGRRAGEFQATAMSIYNNMVYNLTGWRGNYGSGPQRSIGEIVARMTEDDTMVLMVGIPDGASPSLRGDPNIPYPFWMLPENASRSFLKGDAKAKLPIPFMDVWLQELRVQAEQIARNLFGRDVVAVTRRA